MPVCIGSKAPVGHGKGWMRMGIVMQRRKRRQAVRVRRGLLLFTVAAMLFVLPLVSPQIRTWIADHAAAVQAFSQSAQLNVTLPAYDVYALQLAVFDNGERAAAELKRLQDEGVRCVIWQKERMRIVVSAALSRDTLDTSAAKGYEAYVIRDTLPEVCVRLSAQRSDAERAKNFLEMPDRTLKALLEGTEDLGNLPAQVRAAASEAINAHPENQLYTQLAQSLLDWCALMEQTMADADESAARSYGTVTLCTLCRQLRQTLSEPSTASAQRTPSTAADVMPPA